MARAAAQAGSSGRSGGATDRASDNELLWERVESGQGEEVILGHHLSREVKAKWDRTRRLRGARASQVIDVVTSLDGSEPEDGFLQHAVAVRSVERFLGLNPGAQVMPPPRCRPTCRPPPLQTIAQAGRNRRPAPPTRQPSSTAVCSRRP